MVAVLSALGDIKTHRLTAAIAEVIFTNLTLVQPACLATHSFKSIDNKATLGVSKRQNMVYLKKYVHNMKHNSSLQLEMC